MDEVNGSQVRLDDGRDTLAEPSITTHLSQELLRLIHYLHRIYVFWQVEVNRRQPRPLLQQQVNSYYY